MSMLTGTCWTFMGAPLITNLLRRWMHPVLSPAPALESGFLFAGARPGTLANPFRSGVTKGMLVHVPTGRRWNP